MLRNAAQFCRNLLTPRPLSFTLQRVAASCRTFRHLLRRGTAAAAPIWAAAWLTVPVMEETEEGGSHQLVTAAGALRRAPPGERIRLRAGE
jgi:hypothetical protein